MIGFAINPQLRISLRKGQGERERARETHTHTNTRQRERESEANLYQSISESWSTHWYLYLSQERKREQERERGRDLHFCLHLCVCEPLVRILLAWKCLPQLGEGTPESRKRWGNLGNAEGIQEQKGNLGTQRKFRGKALVCFCSSRILHHG